MYNKFSCVYIRHNHSLEVEGLEAAAAAHLNELFLNEL
jgi:hypothetical protein